MPLVHEGDCEMTPYLAEEAKKAGVKLVKCAVCRLCPNYPRVPMDRKGTVESGNEEGRGGTTLYQCPQCKNVEIA
jgi:hypothetical protein